MFKKDFFSYRWVIVGIAIICMLLIYGIRHSFAAFFPSILNEFGWTRGNTALIFALNVLLYGILAPIAGSLADRWRPKLAISLGVLLLGISAASCALAKELWHFYVLFGILLSLGTAFSGAPVIIPTIANWFASKRGTAIGLGLTGGALSFSVVTYAEYLISTFGWRLAFALISGTVVAIVLPLVLLFFRYRPQHQGQPSNEMKTMSTPGNKNVKKVDKVSSYYGDLSTAQILKSHRLWLLMLSYMLYMGIANYMIIAHQVIFFIDLGYGSFFAASVAGSVGVLAAFGTLSGFLSDWIGREKVVTLAAVLSIVSVLILLSQKDASNPWALYIFVFCFGFPMGLHVPANIAGAADLFHGQHFGMVNGILLMGFGLGGAIGPWIGGYIFDVTGSYSSAFIICIFAYCLACISFWIAAPRKAMRHPD